MPAHGRRATAIARLEEGAIRTTNPRIVPLADEDMDAGQAEVVPPLSALGGIGALLNIFRTMARTPKALKRFNLWGGYLLGGGSALPVRERELLILRTGWLCRSGYEWVRHRSMGVEAGLTDGEIERIKQGPDAPGWSAADAALLRAADDLVADQFVADATWAALGGLNERQRMDEVHTVAQYVQVSMILNSFGVQLDRGQTLDRGFPA